MYLKNGLTKISKDTSTSSSEPLNESNAAFCPLNNSSANTINTTKGCEPLLILEKVNEESQSSEKENLDDIKHWFNDSFEYENFEMDHSKNESIPTTMDVCDIVLNPNVTNMSNTETKAAAVSDAATTSIVTTLTVTTNVTTKLQDYYSNESKEEKITVNSSPRAQKQPVQTTAQTSRKQMDIGVYFGLKPKHKATRNKTEDVSVIQQNEVVNEQLKTQCSNGKATSQTRKCPFYKIVDGKK